MRLLWFASAVLLGAGAVPAWPQGKPAAAPGGQRPDSGKAGGAAPAKNDPMAGMSMQAATAEMAAQGMAVHATPPKDLMMRWKVLRLPGLENPLRKEGRLEERVRQGRRVYFQNCVLCHGPGLDGEGQFATAFTKPPRPLDDPTFLPMHPESYVFWRVAKGAASLPGLMEPWNSAMPAFEEILTDEEIWAVVLFLYVQQGFSPGPWMWTEEQMKRGGAHVHVMQD